MKIEELCKNLEEAGFYKKEDIKEFINNLINSLNRNVFNETVSNTNYEDENFTDYNLRFADLDVAIQEELAIYDLMLNKGGG